MTVGRSMAKVFSEKRVMISPLRMLLRRISCRPAMQLSRRTSCFVSAVPKHNNPEEHAGTKTLQIAHIDIVYFLENIILTEERPFHAALFFNEFIPDNVKVDANGLACFCKAFIAGLKLFSGLGIQIFPALFCKPVVLCSGLIGAIEVDQCLHELDMELLIQIINLEGTAADLTDAGVFLIGFQNLNIAVDRTEIFIMKPVVGSLTVQNITGKIKITPEEIHQAFGFPHMAGIGRLVTERIEEIYDLQHVHMDMRQALPAVVTLARIQCMHRAR